MANVGAVTYVAAGSAVSAYVNLQVTRTNPDPERLLPTIDFFEKTSYGTSNPQASVGTFYYENDGIDCLLHYTFMSSKSHHEMRFSLMDRFELVTDGRSEFVDCRPPDIWREDGSGDGGTEDDETDGGGVGGSGGSGGTGDTGTGDTGTGDTGSGGSGGGYTGGTGDGTSWDEDVCSLPANYCEWEGDEGDEWPTDDEIAPDDPCDIDPTAAGCDDSGQKFASANPIFFPVMFADEAASRVRGVHVVLLDSWRPNDGLVRIVRNPNGGVGRAAIYLPKDASITAWTLALATLKRDEATTGSLLSERRDLIVHKNGSRSIRVGSQKRIGLPRWPLDKAFRQWNQKKAAKQLAAVVKQAAVTPRVQGPRRGSQRVISWQLEHLGIGKPIVALVPQSSGT